MYLSGVMGIYTRSHWIDTHTHTHSYTIPHGGSIVNMKFQNSSHTYERMCVNVMLWYLAKYVRVCVLKSVFDMA